MCEDHPPRAGHYFATYFDNSRLIRLHFELLQCDGRATFCRSDSCLLQEYGLTGGRYRLMKSYYGRSTHAEVSYRPTSERQSIKPNEARAVRFDRRSGRSLRLTARARDHHNDHHGDDAAARPQDSRHGHHAAPLHVRSLDRARASSGLEACIARDLWHRPRWRAHPRDPRACDADGHHEGNPHGRHGEPQCARNSGHVYECGSRGVSRYMRPLAMLLLTDLLVSSR
jgi:hypothetical protein